MSICTLLLDKFSPSPILFQTCPSAHFWTFTDAFSDRSINAFLILCWCVCRHVHLYTPARELSPFTDTFPDTSIYALDPSLLRFQTCLAMLFWPFTDTPPDTSIYTLFLNFYILLWYSSRHVCALLLENFSPWVIQFQTLPLAHTC